MNYSSKAAFEDLDDIGLHSEGDEQAEEVYSEFGTDWLPQESGKERWVMADDVFDVPSEFVNDFLDAITGNQHGPVMSFKLLKKGEMAMLHEIVEAVTGASHLPPDYDDEE